MESWDEIRKHNRRAQMRKWAAILFGLPILVYIGSLYITSWFRTIEQADEQLRQTSVPEVSTPAESRSITQSATEPRSSATSSTSVEPFQPTSPANSPDSGSDSDKANLVEAADEPQVFPTVTDDQLQRQTETALRALDRKIEQLQGDTQRLEQFGGEDWDVVKSILQSASRVENLSEAITLAEQASTLLDQLAPEIEYAELQKQIHERSISERLAGIIRFARESPDHPRLPELNDDVGGITREEWLSLAVDELDAASPDDAGFAEAWLPIASAWQVVDNNTETSESIRRARESLPRMTAPERIIESTIDLCQHDAFDPSFAEPLISMAATHCEQVADNWTRGTYYAHLSGLSAKFGLQALSGRLLDQAIAPKNMKPEFGVTEKLILTQRCRAAAWTERPEKLFAYCSELEKLSYPDPAITANCYAHVAIAAARHGDRPAFVTAMLRAESALAPLRVYDYPKYLYAERLAEANLYQRRWQAAVIIANNIPDPHIRASLLFRVMQHAPQEVQARHIDELFQRYADQRGATIACSGYAEYQLRSGRSPLSVIAWIQSLPRASQRAAAYAGVSRLRQSELLEHHASEETSDFDNGPIPAPDLDDPVSILEIAERLAHDTADPLDAAFLWLRIAKTWNLLGKQSQYRNAVQRVDNLLLDAWQVVWKNRPPVRRGYNGGYIDQDNRHEEAELLLVGRIVICLRFLAEMQADVGDSRGAMESCLNLANAAGFLVSRPTFDDLNFLQVKAILNRLESETGVGPDALPLVEHKSARYTSALIAAMSDDLPSLQAAADELKDKSLQKNASRTVPAQAARAYAELAILYAQRGDIEAYRNARRFAQSMLSHAGVPSEMKLALSAADALAGEYALAEANLVRGTLTWFGDANRARSQLAVSLARNGQSAKAFEHAKRITPENLIYRGDAWEAAAKARAQSGTETSEELDEWLAAIESAHDRVAVLCGLAIAAGNTR